LLEDDALDAGSVCRDLWEGRRRCADLRAAPHRRLTRLAECVSSRTVERVPRIGAVDWL